MRRPLFTLGCLGIVTLAACHAPVVRMASPLPVGTEIVRGQLVVHCNFSLSDEDRLIDELVLQRGLLAEKLQLSPSDEPIHIYLFDSAEEYYDFIGRRFPEFPARRAIFVATDRQLAVFAHWGDHVAEDLRHEVTHGYLHSMLSGLPLWLDEGLAEYFEVARTEQHVNRPHIEMLLQNGQALGEPTDWRPDLARLEQLDSAADMTQHDYAEAWAWVHYLLDTDESRRELLQQYLSELGQSEPPEPLEPRLARLQAHAELAVVEHVELLR